MSLPLAYVSLPSLFRNPILSPPHHFRYIFFKCQQTSLLFRFVSELVRYTGSPCILSKSLARFLIWYPSQHRMVATKIKRRSYDVSFRTKKNNVKIFRFENHKTLPRFQIWREPRNASSTLNLERKTTKCFLNLKFGEKNHKTPPRS